MSKYEDIIKHINSLKVGSKISVRSIATELGVSDGTAYRAIRDCDKLGIVSTIPRVGTVRIEKVGKKNSETLSYAEVINIVGGSILGGKEGIYKSLNKFVIGAMTTDAMEKYISPNCLLIIGNREDAQRLALLNDSGVLISGGFNCSNSIKKLADEKKLPIISSSFDTFTIASMINQAMSKTMIKKDIILIEDIMDTEPAYLNMKDTVAQWKKLIQKTKLIRYPVVDDEKKVVGIISLKDLTPTLQNDEQINKIMSKDVTLFTPKTTVAYASHVMGWEGLELCPVVKKKRLVGTISINAVLKALQYAVSQPQSGRSLEDIVLKNFTFEKSEGKMCFKGKILEEMLDPIGNASWSSLNMILSSMGIMAIREKKNLNIAVDSIMTYFTRPIQMDTDVEVYTDIIYSSKSFCKVEVDMLDNKKQLLSKALISAKIMR